MIWIVIVTGLAAQPTFHAEPSQEDCVRRAAHINRAYKHLVHARCITKEEARMQGYLRPDQLLKLEGDK